MFEPRALDGTPFVVDPTAAGPGQDLDKASGGPFRIRATALDGRELVLDGSVSVVAGGAVIVFRDVTDEHFRTEQTLNALFDSIPVAITVVEPGSQALVKVNAAFCSLVGRTADEVIGARPPYPWWDPGRRARPGVGTTAERVYRLPDGRPRRVEVSTRAVVGEDGGTVLLLALIKDTSDDRRMQQQLVQSGKLAAIGELAAGVAHEINNPLFAILGLTEFLLKESEPGSKAHQRLRADPADGARDQGDRPRAARLRARERGGAPRGRARRRRALDCRPRAPHERAQGCRAGRLLRGAGALVHRQPEPAEADLPQPDRERAPGDAERRHGHGRRRAPSGGYAIATVADDGPGIEPDVVEPHLRAVLHDEAQHRRHRARALRQPRHRRGARRRADRPVRAGPRLEVHAPAAALRRGGAR